MKVLRKIIEINEDLCDGCGVCVPACEEGAIQIIDGKARVVAEKYCDGLGACMGECPNGALQLSPRPVAVLQPRCKPLKRHRPVRQLISHKTRPLFIPTSATGRYKSS